MEGPEVTGANKAREVSLVPGARRKSKNLKELTVFSRRQRAKWILIRILITLARRRQRRRIIQFK
jgi:hypothetical protein